MSTNKQRSKQASKQASKQTPILSAFFQQVGKKGI
jgi:hypothetical protein